MIRYKWYQKGYKWYQKVEEKAQTKKRNIQASVRDVSANQAARGKSEECKNSETQTKLLGAGSLPPMLQTDAL